MGRWQEVRHTADLAIHVWGDSLPDLFQTAAEGMFSLVAEPGAETVSTTSVALTAPDVETLLVDWLNELLYLHEVHGAVFSEIVLGSLTHSSLEAEVTGRRVMESGAHIKAVTYHMLRVAASDGGYETEIVFDV